MLYMLHKGALEFFLKHPPFSSLDERSLTGLIECLKMELYPDGSIILKQGDKSGRRLFIIKKGGVRIYARGPDSTEHDLDFRGVGDTFGLLSLTEDGPLDTSAQAVGDTVCYAADRSCFAKLLDDHPQLREHLAPSYFPKRQDIRSLTPTAHSMFFGGSDKVLFATAVKDLAVRDVVTAPDNTTASDAARLMSAHRIGALVIVDNTGRPVGIVTSTDLRDRVLACRKDPSGPVSEIMSRQLVTVEEQDFCFEALLKMMSHDVHHLPVTNSGRMTGIVSNHDFMLLQGTSPLIVVREIEDQSTVEGLASVSRKIMSLISLLLREGANAVSIIRIITNINDRIERKILDLGIKTLGQPPLPFCWIVYGSAGRKEQTFRTDQDNALIYEDPEGENEAEAAAEYFGRYAEFVVSALQLCGFRRCSGDYMATNPKWRQPLSVWKKYFNEWIDTPADKAIIHSVILFDFRGLYGETSLALQLKKHLMGALRNKEIFLKALADLTTAYRHPAGLFGSLPVEKKGDHRNLLDLKNSCLTPLINIVRLFSLESNIPETSTIERIAVLKDLQPIAKEIGDDLEHAFELVSLFRIRHQFERASMGLDPDNFINPKRLNSIEQKNLKEIVRLLSQVLDDIEKKYNAVTA